MIYKVLRMARGRPSKKLHIVKAAAGLFSELGYQGTSIDQVVVYAGVSKPTVYSNFPSKQVLWSSVLGLVIEQAESLALSSVESSWQQTWSAFWQLWTEDPVRIAAYRIMFGEPYKMDEDAHRLFQQLQLLCESKLVEILQERHQQTFTADDFERFMALSRDIWLFPKTNTHVFETEQLSNTEKTAKFMRWASS